MLGKICAHFSGVKKAQLEGHFEFTRVQGDQWDVQLLLEDETADYTPFFAPQQSIAGDGLGEVAQPVEDNEFAGESFLVVQEERQAVQKVGLHQTDVVPLELPKIEEISALLNSHGGVLPLGSVSQNFPGLKRAQLEGIFDLTRVGEHGQWEVRLPGVTSPGGEMLVDGRAVPFDAPLPDLTEEQVMDVTRAIRSAPDGWISLTDAMRACPGVKRKQLEGHFDVRKKDRKHFIVALLAGRQSHLPPRPPQPPTTYGAKIAPFRPPLAPSSAARARAPPVPPRTAAILPLDQDTLMEIAAYLGAHGGSAPLEEVYGAFWGVVGEQLDRQFSLDWDGHQWIVRLRTSANAYEKRRAAGSAFAEDPVRSHTTPGAPQREEVPPIPLDQVAVDSIADFVRSHGGRAPLGKVAAAFPGLKRAQLEGIFFLERAGDQWVVSLDPNANSDHHQGKGYLSAHAPPHHGGPVYGRPPQWVPPIGKGPDMAGKASGKGKGPDMVGFKASGKGSSKDGGKTSDKGFGKPDAPVRRNGSAESPRDHPAPVVALKSDAISEIQEFVNEAGGKLPMGRVAQRFVGVKRSQLEGYFDFQKVGDQWEVSSLPLLKRRRLT